MTVLEIYDLLSTKESGGFGVGWPKDSASKDLGILSISKTLTEISKPEKKTTPRKIKPKQSSVYTLEPRRSSRERNPVPSYRDNIDMQQLPTLRKRARFSSSSSWASYLARPLEEVKYASYEERAAAMKAAEKLQSNLQSENPSFVKSMVPLSSYKRPTAKEVPPEEIQQDGKTASTHCITEVHPFDPATEGSSIHGLLLLPIRQMLSEDLEVRRLLCSEQKTWRSEDFLFGAEDLWSLLNRRVS